MGAVLSLPCFRRQRRRRCSASATTPAGPIRNITISHPRPLGSVATSQASVHGGGPSTGGPRGPSSESASVTQSEKEGRRPFLGLSLAPFGILGVIEDLNSPPPSASRPDEPYLGMPELVGGSDDTHMTTTSGPPGSFPGSTISNAVPGVSSAASSSAPLRRGTSPTLSSCSSGSRSGSGCGSHRHIVRSASSRTRTGHKRTNSHNRNNRPRSSRPRPRSYPASSPLHATTSPNNTTAERELGRTALILSASARRRTLRKIRRVDNGWDYIRSTDLDGFSDKAGRNGKRESILG